MGTLLWILAILSLIGGFFAAIGEEEFVWLAGGLVSFALLGGFATVIARLTEIRDTLDRISKEMPFAKPAPAVPVPAVSTQPRQEPPRKPDVKFRCAKCKKETTGYSEVCPHCGAKGALELTKL